MKKNIYSIKDKLTGFMNITLDTNDMTAKRNFGYAVEKSQTNINYRPSDFDLYCLGVFDDVDGTITSEIRHVANGTDFEVK